MKRKKKNKLFYKLGESLTTKMDDDESNRQTKKKKDKNRIFA